MKPSWMIAMCLAASAAGCVQKAAPIESSDASSAPAPVAKKALPVPPEAKPLADRVADVPSLEAKLAADPAFAELWTPARLAARNTFLTALSDALVAGMVHSPIEAELTKAKLMDAFAAINGILRRTGTLGETTTKIEAHLAATRKAPRLGLWNPDDKGAPLFDATGLAMWLHPNDPAYVQERLNAMTQGQFVAQEGQPVARAWLGRTAEVRERLANLGDSTRASRPQGI